MTTHQFSHIVGARTYGFRDLKDLMAKATPLRSGDQLAGLAAHNAEQRVAAQMTLAALPLSTFLEHPVVPYESDEVTRLIIDTHDARAFATFGNLTVGDFRNWLLSDSADSATLARAAPPVGQVKFPHLWPGQTPPGRTERIVVHVPAAGLVSLA